MSDRRWSVRVKFRGDVILNYPPRGSVHGEIRDISLGGTFVEMPAAGLPVDGAVSLACVLRNGQRRYYRLRGVIVRSYRDGCAIVFDPLDADTRRELHEALYGEHDAHEDKRISA